MKMYRRNPVVFVAFVLLSVFVLSCKTAEKLPEAKLRPMSVNRLLKKVQENAFDYTYLNIKRINVTFEKDGSNTTFRSGINAVKDQSIMLSFSKFNIQAGRVALLPDSVFYVNYLARNFFGGEYKILSDLFNFDFDFNTIQAIVSANIFSFFDGENDVHDFNSFAADGMYIIQSEKVRKLSKMGIKGKTQRIERFMKRMDDDAVVLQTFYFDPVLFVVRRMLLEDKTNLRNIEFNFKDFELVGEKNFPTTIDVVFNSKETNFRLNAKMSGFSTSGNEGVPLKIPERFERIYLN